MRLNNYILNDKLIYLENGTVALRYQKSDSPRNLSYDAAEMINSGIDYTSRIFHSINQRIEDIVFRFAKPSGRRKVPKAIGLNNFRRKIEQGKRIHKKPQKGKRIQR